MRVCMCACVFDSSHFGSTLGDQCTQVGQEVCEASSTTDKSSCLTRPGRTCLREKQPSGVHGSISHVGGRRILMPSETLLYHFGFELTSFVESNSAGAQSKGGESNPMSARHHWWSHQMMNTAKCCCHGGLEPMADPVLQQLTARHDVLVEHKVMFLIIT